MTIHRWKPFKHGSLFCQELFPMKCRIGKSQFFQASLLAISPWMIGTGLLGVSLAQEEQEIEVRLRKANTPDGNVVIVAEEESAEGDKKVQRRTFIPKVKAAAEGVQEKVLRFYQNTITAESEDAATKEDAAKGDAETAFPQSDYWIGVQIQPVPPEVQKHLPIKYGIMVGYVYADSPAAKADLQVDDILLTADSITLTAGEDLVQAVDKAKEQELAITLLREGKETKIALKPVKREEAQQTESTPADNRAKLERLRNAQAQFERALDALRAETSAEQEKDTIDFMLVRPGAFVYGLAKAPLPKGVTVQITHEGGKPPKVHVKKGDQSWEVTADKLDGLPVDLRGYVQQLLSAGGPGAVNANPYVTWAQVAPPLPPGVQPGIVTTRAMPPVAGTGPGTLHVQPTAPVSGGVRMASPATVVNRAAKVTTAVTSPYGAAATLAGVQAAPIRAPLAWSIDAGAHNIEAKLDAVLQKLDALGNRDLEAMKKEIQSLRKQVDELRQEKASESKTDKE
jgi:hypothetical protein